MRRVSSLLIILFLIALLAGCRGASPLPTAAETQISPSPATNERPAADPSSTPATLDERLSSLSIDEFFENSYRQLLLRDPETVLILGLEQAYGVSQPRLTDISDAYQKETYALAQEIRDALKRYDRTALTPEQALSYDIYLWYLEDLLAGQEFIYYDYPATYYPITAVHEKLVWLFTEIHPLTSPQDARAYVERLKLIDEKIDQLIIALELRAGQGIIPPRFALEWARYGALADLSNAESRQTAFYTTLETKTALLSSLPPDDRQALLSEAEQTIAQEVIPAYVRLAETMRLLESKAPTHDGVWQFSGGDAYYDYLLRHHTTTDLTAEQIHQLGLQELERIHGEMRQAFAALGYPEDETLAQSFARVTQDSGTVPDGEVVAKFEELIQQADSRLESAFDVYPQAELLVKGDPFGGYYSPPPLSGERPGVFYATTGIGPQPAYGFPTLAYHETIPGHHFQIALAAELDLPDFRRATGFTGFDEGWALYAERLAADLGWYKDDPYGDLGRLQNEAYRAARLVIDTGLHAKHWTFDQAVDFFVDNTGFPGERAQREVARYIVYPGQATSYYIGFLKLLELRQRAQTALGQDFDLKEFHRTVLLNGSLPLSVLEGVVDGWIAARLSAGSSLTLDQARSLASLMRVGKYPLYTMHTYGASETSAALSQSGIWKNARLITARLSPAGPVFVEPPGWGCSLFAALGDPAGRQYGRNFDWDYSPALLLFHHPPDGYASVSMVDLSYLVDEQDYDRLDELPVAQRSALLQAPQWPFDGMNAAGVVIAMAAVPQAQVEVIPGRPTLDSLAVMREVLDHASSAEQALDILSSFNVDWGGGPDLHYLVADRLGKALLVEFVDGEIKAIPNTNPWRLATNFTVSPAEEHALGRCWRYDVLSRELESAAGRLSSEQALDLLSSVAQDSTQWSVVYDLSSGGVLVAMGREYDAVYRDRLQAVEGK